MTEVAHCRECGSEVTWDVRACPYCGDQNPLGRNPGSVQFIRIVGILALVVVVLILIYVAFIRSYGPLW